MDIEHFLAKVDQTDDCWLWTGGKNIWGYGKFFRDGRTLGAHHVAYELFIGSIPDGQFVLHHCDIRNCVRPSHLFLGSQRDNIRDMYSKGRQGKRVNVNYASGERHGLAKLTTAEVRNIRARWTGGRGPGSAHTLAEEFNVHKTLIWQIATRRIWRHVE